MQIMMYVEQRSATFFQMETQVLGNIWYCLAVTFKINVWFLFYYDYQMLQNINVKRAKVCALRVLSSEMIYDTFCQTDNLSGPFFQKI